MIFKPFPRLVGPISAPPPLAMAKVASIKLSSSSSTPFSRSSLATSVSTRRKTSSRHHLKSPMHRFVVRIALRQHVPLRTCVENPQDRFKHASCRDRLSSRTPVGNVLLRKMTPDALPLLVAEPNHPTFIADRDRSAILR